MRDRRFTITINEGNLSEDDMESFEQGVRDLIETHFELESESDTGFYIWEQ